MQELDTLMDLCAKKAHRFLRKFPNGTLAEDVRQDFAVHVWSVYDKFDKARDFRPWASTVIDHHCTSMLRSTYRELNIDIRDTDLMRETALMSSSGDSEAGFEWFSDSGAATLELIDPTTPETLYLAHYEEEEDMAEIARHRVKSLCKLFEVEYNDDDPGQCLFAVLNMTLNEMSEAEFGKLRYSLQRELTNYGDALTANNLSISKTNKVMVKGVTHTIRRYVAEALAKRDAMKGATAVEVEDMLREELSTARVSARLKEDGVTFRHGSLLTVLWRARERAGISSPTAQNGIVKIVRDIFNDGKGVCSIAGVMNELERRNVEYKRNTVSTLVQRLRSTHGLTGK